jgi:2,7-dihydroxy-5-methyl-1-naphthoate 7-O-methyltransferase
MNLRMLVLTGGRERTLDEHQDLAGTAGLRVVAVHQAADGPMIVECRAS